MKKNIIFFLLLLLACIPIFLGIFHSGFFLTDDGNWMVIRLSAFYEALRQGQFPVRFLYRLNNGYGYPVADFLYPLFLYVGSVIHIFHIPYTLTIKIEFAVAIYASAIGAFLWLRRRFENIAGFVGALVYTLFPYHLWDITKRGSLGEVLAMGIVPFIFLGIDIDNIFLSGVGIGLLITAHNTLTILFLPVIICYFLLMRKFKQLYISIGFGLGCSMFFWLPAIFDLQFTVFSKTAVSEFSQYFLSTDVYSLIGIVSFCVILFSLIRVVKLQEKTYIFFLCVTLLSISLTNKFSMHVWEILHLGSYVQFPFRFLSITALGVGYLSSNMLHAEKKNRYLFAVIILILLYISSWQFLLAKSYQTNPDTFYSTNQDTTTVKQEYMPIWVKKPAIQGQSAKPSASAVTLQTSAPTKLTINTVFFPGWVVLLDNQQQKISTDTYGFMVISIPKGVHTITAKFKETPLRLFADCISFVSILVIAAVFVLKKKGVISV